ncbi:nucleotide-binding protein [Catellatospora sp. NEAU-YM18]|nr:nucleotide-binding protein [Catellatospora tritici]
MADADERAITGLLDEFGDAVAAGLARMGYRPNASPIFRPFSLTVIRDKTKVLAGFSPAEGMARMLWMDERDVDYEPAALVDLVQNHLGQKLNAAVTLCPPESPSRTAQLRLAAAEHVREVETVHALGKLGDLSGLGHLEPHLREFLADHPDYDRNVFIMMRFADTPQMNEIHAAIKGALAERGMHGIRADDRDYTGELWSNIEVYLTCCRYGVAVFEDVDQRDHNPNVALELGYMIGRKKRTLLLKEHRLPTLPSDVVHRLYRPFDMFNIEASVKREVGRWADVDLQVGRSTRA